MLTNLKNHTLTQAQIARNKLVSEIRVPDQNQIKMGVALIDTKKCISEHEQAIEEIKLQAERKIIVIDDEKAPIEIELANMGAQNSSSNNSTCNDWEII